MPPVLPTIYRSSTLPDPPALLPMMRILKPLLLPLFASWFGATAAGRAVLRTMVVVVFPPARTPRGPCDGIITAPAPAPNVPVEQATRAGTTLVFHVVRGERGRVHEHVHVCAPVAVVAKARDELSARLIGRARWRPGATRGDRSTA